MMSARVFLLLILVILGAPLSAVLDVEDIEKRIVYKFANQQHIETSFQVGTGDFKKLESLGDAVLYKVLTEFFYDKAKGAAEIHDQRESYKNNIFLAKAYKRFGLDAPLMTVWKAGEKDNVDQNYAAAMEAVIGAIHLDGGDGKSKKFILNRLAGQKISSLLKVEKTSVKKKSAKRGATAQKKESNPNPSKKSKRGNPRQKLHALNKSKKLQPYKLAATNDPLTFALSLRVRCPDSKECYKELYRIEAKDLASAKPLLAQWALDNIDQLKRPV
jgi:dsRNA-specific ribonuclease